MIKKFFNLFFKPPEDKSADAVENLKLYSVHINPRKWRIVERSVLGNDEEFSVSYLLQYKYQFDVTWRLDSGGLFYNKTEALAALEKKKMAEVHTVQYKVIT